jgi:hypothetical protein
MLDRTVKYWGHCYRVLSYCIDVHVNAFLYCRSTLVYFTRSLSFDIKTCMLTLRTSAQLNTTRKVQASRRSRTWACYQTQVKLWIASP